MATTPSYFPFFPTPYAIASPHHTQIHGGYHYPHPAAAYPPPPPGFVPVPANTTPIHHHRPGFVPSPAYMPPPAPAYAPPPPVPYPPPAQAYGPFGYYPAAATPSTAAPLAVAATPHANFSFPSTAENSDLVFHRATPEFRCQDSKTEEDGSAPPRQDFALHTEKSGSATACKDCALLVEPVLNAPTIQSAEAQAQAEATISKDVPRAVRDLKRRLDAQLARDRTSFDTIKGELAKLTSMASQFALSISKQTNSAIPTSSSLRVTGTAPVASKVFDTMPTSSSGCSKVFGKQSSAAASSPTTSGNSRFGASGSTYAAPQVFGETPTSSLWQGTHGSVPDCCSGRRNLSLSACVSNFSEHSYYALPGNYPLEQDMPEPLLSNKSVGVSDSTPEQQPCKEHTIKAQNGTEVVVKCNSWLTTPLQSIGDQVKGLNTLSLTTPWDPGAAASLETTLSPASVAAQVAQSTLVLCPRVDITAVFESLLVPNLKLSSNVQDDSHVFKETAVYDTDEKDASASRRCLHRSVDIIEAVTEEVEVKVDSGKRIISPARPTDGVFSSTNENNSESELPAVCFNIVSDNAFNEQGRAIWDPGASTPVHSSNFSTSVQQLTGPSRNVMGVPERRKEWDPGDTQFHVLFMAAAGTTTLQYTDACKSAMLQEQHCCLQLLLACSYSVPVCFSCLFGSTTTILSTICMSTATSVHMILVLNSWKVAQGIDVPHGLHVHKIHLAKCSAFHACHLGSVLLPPTHIRVYGSTNIKVGELISRYLVLHLNQINDWASMASNGIPSSEYAYTMDFINNQLRFIHQQGVQKNYNAKPVGYLHTSIFFNTFLPP